MKAPDGLTYKSFIKPDVVEKHFKATYGDDYKLMIEMQYQIKYKNTPVDLIFTHDDKVAWICYYKKQYYANFIHDIELKDKYTIIDIYEAISENARETLKAIK